MLLECRIDTRSCETRFRVNFFFIISIYFFPCTFSISLVCRPLCCTVFSTFLVVVHDLFTANLRSAYAIMEICFFSLAQHGHLSWLKFFLPFAAALCARYFMINAKRRRRINRCDIAKYQQKFLFICIAELFFLRTGKASCLFYYVRKTENVN